MEAKFNEADEAALKNYNAKTEQLKGLTLACIKGAQTGLLLFGHGGNGKSFSIRETLLERGIQEVQPDTSPHSEEEEVKVVHDRKVFAVHMGRITPKGLVKEMAAYPDSIHLLEDAETVFDDANCWGVLRQCLHSQDHSQYPQRRITWKTSVDAYDFYFTGSVIIVGNRTIDTKKPEIAAVASRAPFVSFDVSDEEMIAKMKMICEKGYSLGEVKLSQQDCYKVLEFILTERRGNPLLLTDRDASKRAVPAKLNFRILINGFRFMALGRMEKEIKWQEMLLNMMAKLIVGKRSREERVQDEQAAARSVLANRALKTTHDKILEFCKLVGRDTSWGRLDQNSKEYKKALNTAQRDFNRKAKTE